jgi:YD repeat-containing protein
LKGTSNGNIPFRTEKTFLKYDDKANLLDEYGLLGDAYTSYIWGGTGLFPKAVTRNGRSDLIFFRDFEEGSGGWDSFLTAYDATKTHSGKYAGRIDKATAGEQTSMSTTWLKVALNKDTRFKYSGWIYSNGPTARLILFMKKAGETNYYTYINSVQTTQTSQWVYIEGECIVPQNVELMNIRADNLGGGSVWFDDIRLHPSETEMTTYTELPLIGVTSITQPNQQLMKYEYDPFVRLRLIRDNNGYIVQRMQYNYK